MFVLHVVAETRSPVWLFETRGFIRTTWNQMSISHTVPCAAPHPPPPFDTELVCIIRCSDRQHCSPLTFSVTGERHSGQNLANTKTSGAIRLYSLDWGMGASEHHTELGVHCFRPLLLDPNQSNGNSRVGPTPRLLVAAVQCPQLFYYHLCCP